MTRATVLMALSTLPRSEPTADEGWRVGLGLGLGLGLGRRVECRWCCWRVGRTP